MQIIQIPNSLYTNQVDPYASEGSEPIPIFKNPITELCKYVSRADVVFGCLYNLNHEGLLRALRKTVSCQLITDKEHLRRPHWYSGLKFIYSVDQAIDSSHDNISSVPMLPYWDKFHDSIYIANKEGTINMHNKYLVFCKINCNYKIIPQAVWTGSPNGTYNANLSYENAVYLPFYNTAIEYLNDYKRILSNSEGLSCFLERKSVHKNKSLKQVERV